MGNLTDTEIRELATEYVIGLLDMAEDEASMMNLTETLDEEWFEEGISEDDLDQILEQARSDLRGIRDRYAKEN